LEADGQNFSSEWIEIRELEVRGKIGVPENERENPQKLLISLRFQIEAPFAALNDQLEKTIDYAAVASGVEKIVATSRAHLIEKLVSDIGDSLMAGFPMKRLQIELCKFILPNARYVSVKAQWRR
jgi:dihydroneopterin aldolase